MLLADATLKNGLESHGHASALPPILSCVLPSAELGLIFKETRGGKLTNKAWTRNHSSLLKCRQSSADAEDKLNFSF